MRSRDAIMILAAMLSMACGALVPQWADVLAPLPRIMIMILLFLGFLTVGTDALVHEVRTMPLTVIRVTVMRLCILPVFMFLLFRCLLPDFALGALIYGAAPIGVMAAVYGLMVKADLALILVGTMTTSLLLPLSLPVMLVLVQSGLNCLALPPLQLPEQLSLGDMAFSLCIFILVPFCTAFYIRSRWQKFTVLILEHQFYVSIAAISVANVAIFSRYATILEQSPKLIALAVTAACSHALIMGAVPVFTTIGKPVPVRLSFLICSGTVNNILLMIVSMEFFSINETLMGAAYLVPLYGMLVFYRTFEMAWGKHDH